METRMKLRVGCPRNQERRKMWSGMESGYKEAKLGRGRKFSIDRWDPSQVVQELVDT